MDSTGAKSVASKALIDALSGDGSGDGHTAKAALDVLKSTALKRIGEVQVGEYTGTGAALDVALDFEPIFVLVNNLDDGDTFGFAFNTPNVGTKSQTVVLATAQEAAQGILFTAGAKKFSLGTAATLNETGKKFQYLAIGA